MLEALHEFVTRDAPFLIEERKARLAGLAMMDNPEVGCPSASGASWRHHRGLRREARAGRQAPHRDFLRAGRVALVYATLDGGETGY